MVESDFHDFTTMFDGVMAIYPNAKPATVQQKVIYFRALNEFTADQVAYGFEAHVKNPVNGRFPPLPADVIGNIRAAVADDGRPGAEEAWSLALAARDEAATVVWTSEMADAWGVAHNVLSQGDEVGARMAFKEVYNRSITAARAAQEPIRWLASLGYDKEARDRALSAAVKAGRISQSGYLELAPPEVVLQIEGPAGIPSQAQERLADLRKKLSEIGNPDSRAWAVKLREREEGGEVLTPAQSDAWRKALHDAPSTANTTPITFKAPPFDALPPAMQGNQ